MVHLLIVKTKTKEATTIRGVNLITKEMINGSMRSGDVVDDADAESETDVEDALHRHDLRYDQDRVPDGTSELSNRHLPLIRLNKNTRPPEGGTRAAPQANPDRRLEHEVSVFSASAYQGRQPVIWIIFSSFH